MSEKKGGSGGNSQCGTCVWGVSLVLGIVLVLAGIIIGAVVPGTVNKGLQEKAKFCSEEDASFKEWEEPANALMAIYQFNLTNPNEVMTGAKPQVREVGPFYYDVTTLRMNMKLSEDKVSVSYQEQTLYNITTPPENVYTEPFAKPYAASDDVLLTNVNPVYLKIINQLSTMGGEQALAFSFYNATALPQLANLAKNLKDASLLTSDQNAAVTKALMGYPLSLILCLDTLNPALMGFCLKLAQKFEVTANLTGEAAKSSQFTVAKDGLLNLTSYFMELKNTSLGGSLNHGMFVQRTVREWIFGGYSTFLGGAATIGYWTDPTKCNKSASPPVCGSVRTQACNTCKTSKDSAVVVGANCKACVELSGLCDLCPQAAMALAMQSTLCDGVQQRLKALGVAYGLPDAATAELVATSLTTNTCRKCNAEGDYKFCLVPSLGLLTKKPYDLSGISKQHYETNLYGKVDKPDTVVVGSGCAYQADFLQIRSINGVDKLPVWINGTKQVNPPAAAFPFYTSPLMDCENRITPFFNATCLPISGRITPGAVGQGVGLNGLKTDPSTAAGKLTFYAKPLKRAVDLHQKNVSTLASGTIGVVTYTSKDVFSFAQAPETGAGVPFDGALQLSYDAGFLLLVSLPYFYGANASYFDTSATMINGAGVTVDADKIKTMEEAYDMQLSLEPATGVVMRGKVRTMVSVAFSGSVATPNVSLSNAFTPNMRANTFIPVYWSENGGVIDKEKADLFTKAVSSAGIFLPATVALIVVGVLMTVIGLYCCCKRQKVATA